MSLKPGIGAEFMHEVASGVLQFDLEKSEVDVPSTLQHGPRKFPLGRYLRGRLRALTGKEIKAPDETLQAMAEEMRPLLIAARSDKEAVSFKAQILKAFEGKRSSLIARSKIYKGKKSL